MSDKKPILTFETRISFFQFYASSREFPFSRLMLRDKKENFFPSISDFERIKIKTILAGIFENGISCLSLDGYFQKNINV